MKKTLIGIVIGLVIGVSISVVATGTWETIAVLRNDIKVIVNGNELSADNFLYNDTTYLPVREISESLGMNVEYDEDTNTAVISERNYIMNESSAQYPLNGAYNVPVYTTNGIAGDLGYPYVEVRDIEEYAKSIGVNRVLLVRDDPDGNTKTLYQAYNDENGVLRQRIILNNIPGYGSAVREDYWLSTFKPLLDDMAHQNQE